MIRKTLPPELQDYYNDIELDGYPKGELLKTINCLLFKIMLYRLPDMYQVNGKNSPIYIYYFSTGKRRPTVNCTDILGGVMKYNEETKKATTNYPIAFINAIACVLFKRWNAFTVCTDNKGMFNDGDTVENFQLSLKNVAYNNIEAVKFIQTLPTTDNDNIYAIGVSLGALTMSAMLGIEDVYTKAVIILGGCPLDELIATSDEGMVRGFFEKMVQLYGGVEQAKAKLKEAITTTNEVFKYIPHGSTIVMAMSNGDTSVPSEYQKKLIYLIAPAEIVILKYRTWIGKIFKALKNGHYQTLLYYPYLVYRSIKFLSEKKGEETDE
jgi:dienelactone hydrolase